MEKICIVKRRRIGPLIAVHSREAGPRIESVPWIQSASHIETVPRIETASRVEAIPRVEAIAHADIQQATSPHVLTIELTPDQMERVRADKRFQNLYGPSQAPICLNLHLETASSIKMLKSDQLCDMLQVSKSTLTRLVKAGLLRSHQIGRLRRFSAEDVMSFLSTGVTITNLASLRHKKALAASQTN
jgi:excisionase family DNA binding protein